MSKDSIARTFIFNRLNFLKLAELHVTDSQKKEFNHLYDSYILPDEGKEIPYSLHDPKHVFLTYLIEEKNILVHGSNNPHIPVFEPRDSTLFTGEKVKAVFASSDATWSMFFAIVNRSEYSASGSSLRNLCLTSQTKKGIKRYYYFSLNKEFTGELWKDGMIYLLPKERFKPGGARNEWISKEKVSPIAKIRVSPEDFIFRNSIMRHSENSSHVRNLIKHLLFPKWARKG